MPFLVIISRKDNEDVAVLLPHALFWFSSLLLRIENPDQRHAAKHPLERERQAYGYRDMPFFKLKLLSLHDSTYPFSG
jgi:hypothetical protein